MRLWIVNDRVDQFGVSVADIARPMYPTISTERRQISVSRSEAWYWSRLTDAADEKRYEVPRPQLDDLPEV